MGMVGCYDLVAYCDYPNCDAIGFGSSNCEHGHEARRTLREGGWFLEVNKFARNWKTREGWGLALCPAHVKHKKEFKR